MYKKGLVIAVILLFVTVSIQPVFAKDTISHVKKSDTKELLETIKDLANNQEIQDIIQKSEIKGSPIRFQQLLGRLQKEIIVVIEKNDVLNEKIKQLSDTPCDCEKNNTTSWNFPVICTLLLPLFIFSIFLFAKYINEDLVFLVDDIGDKLHCFWSYVIP